MKKLLTLIAFVLIIKVEAQVDVTLLTFGSYSFEDKITTDDGFEGKIGDGFQWGGGFEFCLREKNALEIIYQHLDTDGYLFKPVVSGSMITQDQATGKVALDYYLLGFTRYQPFTEKISGFSTVNAGLGVLNTKDNSKDANSEKFCWGLRLGLKIQTSDLISLRLHGQVLSAVQAIGGGLYFGTGGTGAGLSGYSTFWQFNLGGSINFLLNGKKKASAPPITPTTEP